MQFCTFFLNFYLKHSIPFYFVRYYSTSLIAIQSGKGQGGRKWSRERGQIPALTLNIKTHVLPKRSRSSWKGVRVF